MSEEWSYVYAVFVGGKQQGLYSTAEKARAAYDALPVDETCTTSIEAWPLDRPWTRWSPTVEACK